MTKLLRSFVLLFIPLHFLFFSNVVYSQITITSNDILGLIGTSQVFEEDTTGSVTVNVGSAGANQIWDFRNVVIQANMRDVEFLSPQGTPFETFFPKANLVEKHTISSVQGFSVYIYAEVTNSSYSGLGDGIVTPDTSFIIELEDTFPLPIEFNATWTTVETDTFGVFPTFATISMETSIGTVDGWGTLKLPIGDFECLRVCFDETEITQTVVLGNVTSTDTTHYIEYIWLSRDNLFLAEATSQDNDTDPNFTNASSFGRISSTSTDVEYEVGISEIPASFKLLQNYPNPFNPETEIYFQLPEANHVVVTIFNTNGQEIRKLTDANYTAGYHSLRWNGMDNQGNPVSSGVYLYQLRTATFSQVRKMSLMR